MPLRALEPKSRASANSATFAHRATELQNYTSGSPDRLPHVRHNPNTKGKSGAETALCLSRFSGSLCIGNDLAFLDHLNDWKMLGTQLMHHSRLESNAADILFSGPSR